MFVVVVVMFVLIQGVLSVCSCNDVECAKCDKLGLLDSNDIDEVDLYE